MLKNIWYNKIINLVFMYIEIIVFVMIISIKWIVIIMEIVLNFWNIGGVIDILEVFIRVKIMRLLEVVK